MKSLENASDYLVEASGMWARATKVGEFLIRTGRDKGRRVDGGKMERTLFSKQ